MDRLITTNWSDIIIFSTLIQGLFLLALLYLNKFPASKTLGTLLLSGMCFAICLSIAAPAYQNFSYIALLITGIYLHRYVRAFFSQKRRLSRIDFVVVLIFIAFVFIESYFTGAVYIYFIPAILAFYIGLMWHVLHNEGKTRGISWWQNPGSRLVWIRNFCLLNTGVVLVWYLCALNVISKELSIIGTLIQVYYVYFQLFRESGFLSPIPLGNKYQKSTLTPYQKSSILLKLDELIVQEKFYLDSDVSLSSLAEKLQTSTHHLSQVINEEKGRSFQELISQLRIREAKVLLKSKEHESTKIEHVANLIGYNSKSSFNTTFKKLTGLTPREFKESRDVQTYRGERLPDRKNTNFKLKIIDLAHGFISNIRNIMVTNFFKVFFRRLFRNKVFTAINLFGLTVGFTCSILIYLFISEHLSYDRTLPDSDQIYRITWITDNPQTRTPHPMAQAMAADFPEVIEATTISPWYGSGLSKQTVRVENLKEDISFSEPDFYFVDSTFLNVFDLEVVAGDVRAFSKPWNIVISEEIAIKYFGTENPIGQELTVDDWGLEVAAVVKGMPKRSHFHFTGLISYVTLKKINPTNPWFTWADFGHFNYIKTKPDTDHKTLEAKIPQWVLQYLDWGQDDKERLLTGDLGFRLQPIHNIHLHSHLRWELENNSNILYIYILSGALVFILVIVCINYINLTTAKSTERAREVGIRKTLGALSFNLTTQYYLESLILCLISLLIAVVLSIIILPFFNHLSNLSFSSIDILSSDFLLKLLGSVLIISILSGIYPALMLNNFKPIEVLKGKFTATFHGKALRNTLVVFQFFVSAILIIASLIILRQLDYMKNKELGFDQEALISIKIHASAAIGGIDTEKVRLMESEFLNIPGVKGTSAVSNLPGGQFNQATVFLESEPEEKIDVSELFVDYQTLEVLDLKIIEGRSFQKSFASDSSGNNYILNKTAIKALNLKEPIGRSLGWSQGGESGFGTIVGVVEDFHFESLHKEIQPMVMSLAVDETNHLIVKMEGNQFQKTLGEIRELYAQYEPNYPFEYHFLNDQLEELYTSEVRTLNIFSIFAAIALFLACIGLLGLAIALLNQNVKEIGIRKILGAQSRDIFTMILMQFLKLIGIALIFGLPIGYWLMQVWVREFSYQAPIGLLPFLIAGVTLVVVAISSVSMVILKIANTNPANTLRYE